jgi:hypothetical protein
MTSDGNFSIDGDDMELAGEIIQDLCHHLQVCTRQDANKQAIFKLVFVLHVHALHHAGASFPVFSSVRIFFQKISSSLCSLP